MKKVIVAALGVAFAFAVGSLYCRGQVASATARFEANDAGYIKADDLTRVDLGGGRIIKKEKGVVNGDVFCAGKDLIVNGTVNGDVICAGMTITINGKVTGDIGVAGSSVTIGAEVGGNLTAFGGTVTLESAARVARDAVIAGNDVLVNGTVGRDIVARGTNVTLNGPVGRNVEGQYESLTIGKDATIAGFLHYTSVNDAVVSGKVSGDVKRFESQAYSGQYAGMRPMGMVAGAVIGVLWVVVMAFMLVLILPKKMKTITSLSVQKALFATLLGFFALFTLPIVAGLAMLTIVGVPLGIVLLLAWIALIITSAGVTAVYVGRLITRKRALHPLISALLGGLLVGVLVLIPIVDIIVIIVAVSFGLGAVLYSVRGEYETAGPKAKLARG